MVEKQTCGMAVIIVAEAVKHILFSWPDVQLGYRFNWIAH